MFRVLPVAMLLLACGCGPAPAASPSASRAAIVGGQPDTSDDAVAALLITQPDGSGSLCSGSIIGPRSFLTAAHCLAELTTGSTAEIVRAASIDTADSSAHFQVDAWQTHPDYHQASTGDWSDLGMAHTVSDMPGPYLEPNRYPLERIPVINQPVRQVGYGDTHSGANDYGLRRVVTKNDFVVVSPGELREGPVRGLTCNGDSGGPALLVTPDGKRPVIGLVSRGDDACAQQTVSTRLDPYLDFVKTFMIAHADAPSCGADGRCGFDCTSPDPDCPCVPDGLCTPDCPTPTADPDCPQSCLFDGGACNVKKPTQNGPVAPPSTSSGGCASSGGLSLLGLIFAALLVRRQRSR